ncbi:MAG: MoaD/ThiS family protein [Thermodesulfobacteriota bacterium]
MKPSVQIKLFADLSAFTPPGADTFPIKAGTTVRRLLDDINVPAEKVRLVFINNIKGDLDTILKGGERVGIFPPIGGG